MGLEALVESYAFWRPSLRTLTFEDIPGMAKQGRDKQQLWRVWVCFFCTVVKAEHISIEKNVLCLN